MTISTINRIASILMSVCVVSNAFGQNTSASGEFSLQGRLTTSAGAPLADGQHSLTANIYAKGSAQVIYTETDNIITSDGLFSTTIGGNGSGKLNVDAKADYELGVTIDGEAELSPKITLGSALKAITADLAANADAVGGFGVSASGSAQANTLLVLNNHAKISSSLIDSGIVASVNGLKGNVTVQGGGDLAVNTQGSTINLSFTGSGNLNLPLSRTVDISSGSAFSITNTLGASAASFINSGSGIGLAVSSMTGAAISATANAGADAVLKVKNQASGGSAKLISALDANGSAVLDVAASGKTTINSSASNALDVTSSAGAAINATANASADAVLKVKNEASSASAKLISAIDANGSAVLDVAANGKTTITSTVGDALNVSTSAAGEAALKVTGGVKFIGAAGTGTVMIGQLQATVNNALVKANSIVLLTVTGGGVSAVPLRIASQANGSFVVSVFNGIGALTGDVNFAYLIINQ